MLWMVLIRSVKAVVVASELPQQNLMLFFANPQLSTLKCNSPSPLLAKVERRVYGRGGGKTTVCYYYFLLLPKSCGNASLWPSWWTKKIKLKWDGWSTLDDPLKKKEILTPPKIKYLTLLLQPKNTIASLLIISEQHHPVAATLTTTQWLKISKESLMFYKVYFQRKFDNSNETFFVSFQTLLYTIWNSYISAFRICDYYDMYLSEFIIVNIVTIVCWHYFLTTIPTRSSRDATHILLLYSLEIKNNIYSISTLLTLFLACEMTTCSW